MLGSKSCNPPNEKRNDNNKATKATEKEDKAARIDTSTQRSPQENFPLTTNTQSVSTEITTNETLKESGQEAMDIAE